MGILHGKCNSKARLDGKTAIVTGSNTGIGKFTAQDLYKRGCRVIMACRSAENAKRARDDIISKTIGDSGLGELVLESLDLASLQSVREFAERILEREAKIDILLNNGGVMACPKSFTKDGFELQFGTNHLGHFLLTLLLLPRILNSTPARIINVSSMVHSMVGTLDWDNLNAEKSYNPVKNYCVSKVANILFTCELARRLQGQKVNVYSLHPGVVKTDLSRHADAIMFPGARWFYDNIGGLFYKNIQQGSQTSIYCAVEETAGAETGLYYSDCKPARMSRLAADAEVAKKLWEVSLKMVKLENYDPFTALDQPIKK